ncbi:MAG: hypothetical protein HYS25_03610 [Ignavibacteriales bacterium]|nr:hypothetical protein [Ignavibacteriales bacterium]
MIKSHGHKFHIPVLGVGFSVDAPVKVARFGISSVISLVDDTLMEQLRKHYLEKSGKQYIQITDAEEDPRAKRITAYLNTINQIVQQQFEKLRNSTFEFGSELNKYFEMLPDFSELKKRYKEMLNSSDERELESLRDYLRNNISHGSIDVNIMTKLDKANYNSKGEILPAEYNDAHAALRGFALSELEGSIIFSAGMNPKLYSYMETFKDFLPGAEGSFKKKIVIKVSDFRSALIQGKFLAKKGLWISEFRIESGLNCGGHAFATDGLLMGPILEEFKNRKDELLTTLKEMYLQALIKKEIQVDEGKLNIDITVQGGVGKSSEQNFLIRQYGVKSVGWGSPFLLVPEVMNVDDYTLQKLCDAGEDDFYLSDISPLGVPFNNLRDNSKDIEKWQKAENGKPGSACTKKFLLSNKEYSDKPICTASITYLKRKIADLKAGNLDESDLKTEINKAVDKACLCEGLTVPALIVNNIESPKQSRAVSVCPGPNLAYFSKTATLKEMIDHIYGRINLITHTNRPNMFVKELSLYIDYLQRKIEDGMKNFSSQTETYVDTFKTNLMEGIDYYKKLIPEITEEAESVREKIREDLEVLEQRLMSLALVSI